MRKSPKKSSVSSRNPQKSGLYRNQQEKRMILPLAIQRTLALFATNGADFSDEDGDTCPADVVYRIRKHHKRIFNSAFVLCVIFGAITFFSISGLTQKRY